MRKNKDMQEKFSNIMIAILIILGVLIVFLLGYTKAFPFSMPLFFVAAIINLVQLKQTVKKQENNITSSQRITFYRSIAVVFVCSIGILCYIVHYFLK